MSVEAPKVEETALPPATKPVESPIAPAETTAAVATEAPAATEAAKETTTTPAAETAAKDDAVVEAVPATEGPLGYKAPGLLKQLRYVKHFFWFSEEPLTQEALDSYVKNEKAEAYHKAAWAQETGKGVLFFAKRAEDKATPSGIILLPAATALTKVGSTDFSFKVGHQTHKFEAASAAERDSWVVAIQKIVDETKDLKTDITGRESYKKTIEGYSSSPVAIGASSSPKKSLDANTAAAAATTEASSAAKPEEANASSTEDAKNKGSEKKTKKERSQSRKRNSVFGLFGKKDEDKAEKEHDKEVKKAEAEQKKEEAKAEHDPSKAKDAVEAAAVAAAPAAVAASVEKEEDKKEENPAEKAEEVTTPTEKKSKRTSVFSGFFGKNKVTSPSQEKTAEEAGPAVPAKDETPAVSETAPKLDEPIDTKPIDAAAVTAPVDNPESTAAPAATAAAEEPKTAEPVSAAETATSPKTEKKGFLAGLIKKHDKKEEAKEEAKTDDAAKETATAETATTEPAAEAPAKETEAPKEERPAREKRRTSLFGSLGTLKRKTEKSPGPESPEEQKTETKREKSPLPSKLGGLFRRPSRATKTEEPKEVKSEEAAADATKTEAAAEAPKTEETPAATETPANATTAEPKGDSEIVGDVVPETLHTTVDDATAQKPEEVKATA